MTNYSIDQIAGPADIEDARVLFGEYARWLDEDHGISLAFQDIEAELAGLPGKYERPNGDIILARGGQGLAAGCAAFRPFSGETCEIKRLYVRPVARGHGLGQRLVAQILKRAREAGYRFAVLDTGGFMIGAQQLYERFGFVDIPKYYDNPIEDVRYMKADLTTLTL